MKDITHKRRIGAVAAVAMLVLAAFSGGAGAAGTAAIDEETATTTYTSEIVTGTTVSNVTGNLSATHVVTVKSDSNSSKAVLREKGAGYDAAVNDTGENVDHNASGSEMNWLNHTFTNGQLLDVEHSPGENVTMLAQTFNNTSVSDSDAVTANVTWYAEFNNDTATTVVDDSEVDEGDIVTVADEEPRFNISLLGGGSDSSSIEAEDMTVPEETLYIASANSTVSADISDAIDEFDSESKMSSVLGFSAWGPNAYVSATDGDKTVYIPVFAEDPGEDAPDTYAIATSDVGGSTGFAVHGLSEEFDSGDEIDVTAAAGTGLDGWFNGYIVQGLSNFSMTIGSGISGGAFAFVAPVGLARRRRDGPSIDAEGAEQAEA